MVLPSWSEAARSRLPSSLRSATAMKVHAMAHLDRRGRLERPVTIAREQGDLGSCLAADGEIRLVVVVDVGHRDVGPEGARRRDDHLARHECRCCGRAGGRRRRCRWRRRGRRARVNPTPTGAPSSLAAAAPAHPATRFPRRRRSEGRRRAASAPTDGRLTITIARDVWSCTRTPHQSAVASSTRSRGSPPSAPTTQTLGSVRTEPSVDDRAAVGRPGRVVVIEAVGQAAAVGAIDVDHEDRTRGHLICIRVVPGRRARRHPIPRRRCDDRPGTRSDDGPSRRVMGGSWVDSARLDIERGDPLRCDVRDPRAIGRPGRVLNRCRLVEQTADGRPVDWDDEHVAVRGSRPSAAREPSRIAEPSGDHEGCVALAPRGRSKRPSSWPPDIGDDDALGGICRFGQQRGDPIRCGRPRHLVDPVQAGWQPDWHRINRWLAMSRMP